jgi:hypothetical protein
MGCRQKRYISEVEPTEKPAQPDTKHKCPAINSTTTSRFLILLCDFRAFSASKLQKFEEPKQNKAKHSRRSQVQCVLNGHVAGEETEEDIPGPSQG